MWCDVVERSSKPDEANYIVIDVLYMKYKYTHTTIFSIVIAHRRCQVLCLSCFTNISFMCVAYAYNVYVCMCVYAPCALAHDLS